MFLLSTKVCRDRALATALQYLPFLWFILHVTLLGRLCSSAPFRKLDPTIRNKQMHCTCCTYNLTQHFQMPSVPTHVPKQYCLPFSLGKYQTSRVLVLRIMMARESSKMWIITVRANLSVYGNYGEISKRNNARVFPHKLRLNWGLLACLPKITTMAFALG